MINSDEDSNSPALLNLNTTELKIDHSNRPLWINSNGRIILESFSALAKEAEDLLLAIAEPITRPKFMHEYQISSYSLYAAVSVGLEPESIIQALSLFCKTQLPTELQSYILNITKSFGKFWLQSKDPSILIELLKDNEVVEARVEAEKDLLVEDDVVKIDFKTPRKEVEIIPEHVDLFEMFDDKELDDLDPDQYLHNEHNVIADVDHPNGKDNNDFIKEHFMNNVIPDPYQDDSLQEQVENIKRKCSDLAYPVLEEYDFRADLSNTTLDIDLKAAAKLRPYQEKALQKLFSNGRARSGIIVLPCGSGKTLVGVTAACTIKKNVLVLCNSSLSVEQWCREFRYWSTIAPENLARFSSEKREMFQGDTGVLISTYTMVTFSGKRAHDAQKVMDFIQSREWGFLLMDEVHVVPADVFKKTLTIVAAHCKLGLTATLVREDEKIDTLNWLIGPKLYEANWSELADAGYIAKVQCSEVWCDMSFPFYREYLREDKRKRQLLYVMNPRKIQACHYLVMLHESLGDKIIIFSDNIFALKHYASILNRPYIYGGTSQVERKRILRQFRFNPALNTIFLSKVGDTSLDLPEATCLIQISSQYGSRRQEAQRLGRILRPKKGFHKQFSAYFYTLVSADTEEMYFSSKRQQYLIDQGYEFKIIPNLIGMESENTPYQSLSEQLSLLNSVLLSAEKDEEEEEIIDSELEDSREQLTFTRTSVNSLSTISGGTGLTYVETTLN